MEIINQVKGLAPSIKPALYRRLMIEPNLAYLRKDQSIIGFEVEMVESNVLTGYAIIGIQKHTILAMCSDLDEPPRLILFPSLEKLRDPAFGLQDLKVIRTKFSDDTFHGMGKKTGPLLKVAENIIPPHHDVDIDDGTVSAMSSANAGIEHAESVATNSSGSSAPDSSSAASSHNDTHTNVPNDLETPPVDEPPIEDPPTDEPPIDEPPMDEPPINDGMPDFDDTPDFDAQTNDMPTTSDTPPEDTRVNQLESQSFQSLDAVSTFAVMELKLNHDLVNKVIYAALNATPDKEPQMQAQVAVLLLEKLIHSHKI